jgi:type II secretory pathway pseudopilin PulG
MHYLEREEKMHTFTGYVRQWCAQRGVAPIEIVIVLLVLGVLASLIIPPFSAAKPESRDTSQVDSALRDALQFVRTQITVFKAQHREVPPGYPDGDMNATPDGKTFRAQLTEYSDQSCRVSPAPSGDFPLGKYLDAIPANSLNGKSDVWISTAAAPAADPSRPFGWIYNPKTLDFRPNSIGTDSQGVAYSDY